MSRNLWRAHGPQVRAVLTGTGLDVQPERLFGGLAALSQQALGKTPKIGSQIAVAKAALDRQHLDADRTEAS